MRIGQESGQVLRTAQIQSKAGFCKAAPKKFEKFANNGFLYRKCLVNFSKQFKKPVQPKHLNNCFCKPFSTIYLLHRLVY